MNTKLTLRLDKKLIDGAKAEAEKRGKSVSQMVADYFQSLSGNQQTENFIYPPITQSLHGIIKESDLSEEDYKTHLREKH